MDSASSILLSAVPAAVWRRFPAVERLAAADNEALVEMWMRSFRCVSALSQKVFIIIAGRIFFDRCSPIHEYRLTGAIQCQCSAPHIHAIVSVRLYPRSHVFSRAHSRDCLFGFQFRNDEQRRVLMRCNMYGLLQQLDTQPPAHRLAFAIRQRAAVALSESTQPSSSSVSSASGSVVLSEAIPLPEPSANQLVSAAILLDAGTR
jgi:hypothetical protein